MGKPNPATILDPAQCRAGRALLGWSQAKLAEEASVNKRTIMDFETSGRQPYERTLSDLRNAMEANGVRFIGDRQSSADGGSGARMLPVWRGWQIDREAGLAISKFAKVAFKPLQSGGFSVDLPGSPTIIEETEDSPGKICADALEAINAIAEGRPNER
jgi:transcriptional regulator with XRE-family HTH domain